MAALAKKIMIGYDGSDAGRRALDRAAELAGYGSVVTVLGVGCGRERLAEARDRLLRRHVEARCLEPASDAPEALVDKARELEADLLVVPDSGVVPDAPCDVLVVR